MSEHRYLTVAETAELLRVSPETVRRCIRSGKLKTVLPYRPYRIDRKQLEENNGDN